MYGLPQAPGKVASDFLLLPRLTKAGYIETGRTPPGLFKHKTNSIKSALVVDDFLVKSCCQADLDSLSKSYVHTQREHYTITVDEKASQQILWHNPGWTGTTPPGDPRQQESHPFHARLALLRFTHATPTNQAPASPQQMDCP
jgi:hypothetical protein